MFKGLMRVLIGVILQFICLCFSAHAQSRVSGLNESKKVVSPAEKDKLYIDSLERELKKPVADSTKAHLFARLDQAWIFTDPAKSEAYERRRLEIGIKDRDLKMQTYAYISLSRAAIYQNKLPQAIDWLRKGFAIAEKEKDSIDMGKALINLGAASQASTDNSAALNYYIRAAHITAATHDTAFFNLATLNIGAIYYGEDDYPRAEEYVRQALPLVELSREPIGFTKANELLGNIYAKEKKTESALLYYFRTIAFCREQHNDIEEATIYSHLAGLYLFQHDSALFYSFKAKAIFDRVNPDYFIARENLANIGSIYYAMAVDSTHRYKEGKTTLLRLAEKYLQTGEENAQKTHKADDMIDCYRQLAYVQHLLKEDSKAYPNLMKANLLNDSLFSQEQKNKLASADEKYQVQLREDQLTANRRTFAIQARQKYYFIAGIALLLVIGGLLLWQNRTRTKANRALRTLNQQLDQANEVKTRFMGILNHDLRAPVTNLVNILHLQKNSPDLMDESKTAAHSDRIRGQAVSLLETMEDLLSWSKGQMKNFQPQLKDVSAGDLFADIKNTFSGTPDIVIGFSNPENLIVHTDAYFLKTIMRNLTSNAVKSLIGDPAAAIQWTAFTVNAEKVFVITDNGPGITEEALKPLYDESMPSTLKSGLGMHLVRDLARIIGCRVAVNTEPGKGTEFRLYM